MNAPTTLLPLAPLTVDELRDRREVALRMCGYRCEAVFETDDDFEDFDLEKLREHGRQAATCFVALRARGEVA